MKTLQLNQLKRYLENNFTSIIDISDVAEEQNKTIFFSRALAFYALKTLANVDSDIINDCITDGYNDNGIDAIFYQRDEHILWLVQSKFKESASGAIEDGDVLKFTKGIRDIIEFNAKQERFNDKIIAKSSEINDALEDYNIKFKCVLAYSSNDTSAHMKNTMNDLLNEINTDGEYLSVEYFGLKEQHDALKAEGNPINLDIDLNNWGKINEPYCAYYGQVYAVDIANWYQNYKEKLSSKNIRGFKGETIINEKIIETLLQTPERFFYFNNGITIICKDITYKRNPPNHEHNGFCCFDVSVVNGAQTVGCIAEAYNRDSEKIKDVKVLVRLISLKDTPNDFGDLITNATNTQNKVSNKDFASKDKIQIKLMKDLYLDGINYYIKNYEGIQKNAKSFDLEDVAIALACSSDDISLVNVAKGQVGKLYEDINKRPYTTLFNEQTKYYQIKHIIKVLFAVDEYIEQFRNRKNIHSLNSRERGFYIHGNRFLLHLLYSIIPKEFLFGYNDDKIDNYINSKELERNCKKLADIAIQCQENLYPNAALHQLYKNKDKCTIIKNEVIMQYSNSNN